MQQQSYARTEKQNPDDSRRPGRRCKAQRDNANHQHQVQIVEHRRCKEYVCYQADAQTKGGCASRRANETSHVGHAVFFLTRPD